MPATHNRPLVLVASRPDEPPVYVINLYTSLSDPAAAADLAIAVSEHVRDFEHVSHLSTTITIEDDVTAEPVSVYADFVK